MRPRRSPVLRVLEFALEQEAKACEFYAALARQVKDRPLKNKLESLSEFERGHERVVAGLYKDAGGAEPPIPAVKKRATDRALRKKASVSDVLGMAIEAERLAQAFYVRAARKCQTEAQRAVLERLAEEEKQHEELLASERNLLEERSLWFTRDEVPWMLETE